MLDRTRQPTFYVGLEFDVGAINDCLSSIRKYTKELQAAVDDGNAVSVKLAGEKLNVLSGVFGVLSSNLAKRAGAHLNRRSRV